MYFKKKVPKPKKKSQTKNITNKSFKIKSNRNSNPIMNLNDKKGINQSIKYSKETDNKKI